MASLLDVHMKFFTLFFSIALLFSPAVFSNEALPAYSQHYDDTRNPFDDAKAAIKLANETNRNVLIEIGGEWCGWCAKMDAFLIANPGVASLLHQNFVLIKVNVSDSNENAEFMKGLPPVLGYPHMYVASPNGKMLLSKDTAELLEGDEYDNWLDFIDKWQPNAIQVESSLDQPVKKTNNALNTTE